MKLRGTDLRAVAAEKRYWNSVRPGIWHEMLDRYTEIERLMAWHGRMTKWREWPAGG